ncbi:50S ribosomal protein L10, chloroplastic [Glycine max]|nr:50S ribosomal protein L10, chloroplastic [Glycine max]
MIPRDKKEAMMETELRKTLPKTVKLIVARNMFVDKVVEGMPWDIPFAIKPFRNFQKEKKLEDNDFTNIIF